MMLGRPLRIGWRDAAEALAGAYRREHLWSSGRGCTRCGCCGAGSGWPRSPICWGALSDGAAVGRLVPERRIGRGAAASARWAARCAQSTHARAAAGAAGPGGRGRLRHRPGCGPLGRAAVRGALHRGRDALPVPATAFEMEGPAPPGWASLAGRADGLGKRGLTQALATLGLSRAHVGAVAWSDELRLGLHGQVRRRWAPALPGQRGGRRLVC